MPSNFNFRLHCRCLHATCYWACYHVQRSANKGKLLLLLIQATSNVDAPMSLWICKTVIIIYWFVLGKGHGGLCETPAMGERRMWKAKRRGRSGQVYLYRHHRCFSIYSLAVGMGIITPVNWVIANDPGLSDYPSCTSQTPSSGSLLSQWVCLCTALTSQEDPL